MYKRYGIEDHLLLTQPPVVPVETLNLTQKRVLARQLLEELDQVKDKDKWSAFCRKRILEKSPTLDQAISLKKKCSSGLKTQGEKQSTPHTPVSVRWGYHKIPIPKFDPIGPFDSPDEEGGGYPESSFARPSSRGHK
jgi:hypothetical protein